MSRARINPNILIWARERSSLNIDATAKKIGVKSEFLLLIERGKELPTFKQAQDLANAFHIPFGYLFLSTPPETISPIVDFRTLPNSQKGHFSIGLEQTVNDALRKRDWLREWRIQEGEEALPFVGKFSIQDSIKSIAEDISQILNIDSSIRQRIRKREVFLQLLITKAEKAGILVLQNSVVLNDNSRSLSLEEFRGFSLVDEYAPIIFINTNDSISARIFTFGHELAHIWLGSGGISNPSFFRDNDDSEIEKFCNKVAAEFLMPEKEFLSLWNNSNEYDIFEKNQDLAEYFKVSIFAILIRAYENNKLDKDVFMKLYHEAEIYIEPKLKKKDSVATFFNVWRVRNGKIFVNEMLSAVRRGNVLYSDAAKLLNIKIKTLDGIMQKY